MNGESVRVHWRGHYTSVKPNEPQFTAKELKMRLSKALTDIKLPTDEEREFCKNKIKEFAVDKHKSHTNSVTSQDLGYFLLYINYISPLID